MSGFAPSRRRAGALLGTATLLAGCVAPAVNSGAFTENATAALSSTVGVARTASLAVHARLEDRVTKPYTDTVVTESESALGPIQASFGNVDPPTPQDDPLRDRVMSLLGDTADALADARIAVRRQDSAQMRESARTLDQLADQMELTKDGLG